MSPKVDFPALDHDVMRLWEERNVLKRTITERSGAPEFVAYDGPPGTNGAPHIGHMMQSALKDLWPRYFTMKGYLVRRKAGWDTHGLPVELTAEKELGLHSKREIVEYGLEKYIQYCRETVFRYKAKWTEAIHRIGRFLDTDDDYATLTDDYIQTDWWVLKQAWDQGLLYQGRRTMPHCPRCGTSLSAHETAQGYKDISDVSLFVKFKLADEPDAFFVAWTTTAWTLISNVALAVNPYLNYVTVQAGGEKLIFAEARLEAVKSMLPKDWRIIDRHPGSFYAQRRYQPLWSFLEGVGEKAHQVLSDTYVTAEDGSGIVHLALYGEDDFRLIQANDLPLVQNVDLDGKVNDVVTPFAGRWFREEGLDVDILKDLASHGLLLGKLKIEHSYPHCYRCDTPLMYYAKSGWFLKTSAFKDRMLRANEDINWYPDHIKRGRFGNWLENNVDWNISRERYWGSPLPIWTCQDCGEQVCFGSFAELGKARGGLPVDFDPHKPGIDNLTLTCPKCGGVMRHEPEVLDPWFNAGIMPWGQWGYPAKPGSAEIYEQQYPADFICEAIDQTRGWFYTMLATATYLTDRSSFKNVICTEHVLDDEGHKMSKSRGNVVDAVVVCDKFGADAVRWYFFAMNPWTVRRFKDDDVREVLKQTLIPYWNAYSFFVTYARVDGWHPSPDAPRSQRTLDRWILSRREWLREELDTAMLGYDVARASAALNSFIDDLTNWHIRRSRRRFWKSEDDRDKADAYNTLYRAMSDLNRLMAPFAPFVSEAVYQNLERGFNGSLPDSVHLCMLPEAHPDWRDLPLEGTMDRARRIVSMGRALRNEGGKPVRQPLQELVIAGLTEALPKEYIELIADELNVKALRFVEETKSLYTHHAKANFKALGARLGKRMKEFATLIEQLDDDALQPLLRDGRMTLSGEAFSDADIVISVEAVEGYWIRTEGGLTVAVDYRVSRELYQEWLAREFVHQVQNMRRDADLEVTQRIRVAYVCDDELADAVRKHREYIQTETLSLDLLRKTGALIGDAIKIGDQSGWIELI